MCRLPRRPSEVLRLREELGIGPRECLDFDVACVEYDREMERRESATREEPAPKAKKRRTHQVPKWEPEQLLLWQGLDPDEIKRQGLAMDPGITAMADDILAGKADWLYLDE